MNDAEHNPLTFSFVVPVHNEQEGLLNFYTRLTAAAEALNETYEIIFVDDGSQDETPGILRRLIADDLRVKVVEFSRNFGHQVAVTAGYDHASGRAVISLDGDCQHPPEVIADLVARWREGFEVVYTVRKDTVGISAIRRGIGRLIYRIIACVSGAKLTDQADFRLLDRKAVDALKAHREHARFVRGLVRWIGFRQISVPYVAGQRRAGSSSYSLRQLAGMVGAGVFNFSLRPLRLAAALGAILLGGATLFWIIALILWPLGMIVGGWTHLWMVVLAMFGLQFLALGILGEYVGRTFDEAKARPLYVVRETLGFPEARQLKDAAKSAETAQENQRFSVFT